MNIKMVICIRKDLNMRKGKMIAQGCHASMKIFLDRTHIQKDYDTNTNEGIISNLTENMVEWMQQSFTKVVVGVDTEEEIYDIANQAKVMDIPFAIIVDNGFTEFHGNRTTTCVAIGPDTSEKIDKITGKLKLI